MSSPRSNFVCATAIALALHALLAVALALHLNHAPAPDELAELDLARVDLSFAETVEESAAAAAGAANATSEPAKATTPPVAAAPAPSPVDAASPPRQAEPRLPSPAEPPELLPPAVARQDGEVARREAQDAKDGDERHETKDRNPEPSEAAPAQPRQASAPRQASVDAPPRPRRSIKPDYPRESRLRGERGDASLELDVATDGSVRTVRLLKSTGHPLLDEAAAKAARAARFTPAQSGGKPVASSVRLTLAFRLK